MGSNRKIDFKHQLEHILSGKLTESEKDDLHGYILNSFEDSELEIMMYEHWSSIKNEDVISDEIQILTLKNKILSKINQQKKSTEKELRLFPEKWNNYLLRIAAMLFIPLLLGSILVFYQMDKQLNKQSSIVMQKVTATPGSRVHFTLPDSTEVWLNSGSTLEFPLNLNHQDQRMVKLVGQGYFQVAHDKDHPFFVEIELMNVKVLGTAFDVSNYTEDRQISSTLEEGSIVLMSKQGKEIANLQPGQQAILDKNTNKLVVTSVETALSTSWKDGKLIFRNTSLFDVMNQLERWFNCEIHIDPELTKSKLRYTATIQDETLGEVLKMIEISTSVKTRIEKREVYIGNK